MKTKLHSVIPVAGLLTFGNAVAQDSSDVDLVNSNPAEHAHLDDPSTALVDESDQSGTNPINFTFDARLYNEYQWLNLPVDGGLNITTLEFRAPFADGKWQFRTRLYGTYLDVDDAGIDEFGFGDMDFRLLTVPIMIPEKKFALAYGAEFFLPTATHDLLGSQSFTVGPQVFLGFFGVFDWIDLVAPGYQHRFTVLKESGATDVHAGVIDLFILKTFNDKQQWAMLNPQGLLNYEAQNYWVQFDVEVGTMLPADGHSVYLRPSLGLSSDRPYDWSLEAGYKIVW